MSVSVTAVHMTGGSGHEHIAEVRWVSDDNQTGQSSRSQMVQFLNDGGTAFVRNGSSAVAIGVVKATPPYIRTHANGVWTDNLLSLPKY